MSHFHVVHNSDIYKTINHAPPPNTLHTKIDHLYIQNRINQTFRLTKNLRRRRNKTFEKYTHTENNKYSTTVKNQKEELKKNQSNRYSITNENVTVTKRRS